MILRSRVILPVSGAPVGNGQIRIVGDRIASLGPVSSGSSNVVDLGDAILLPGLVNAHCHLDYTDMAGKLPPPRVFTDWIKAIVELKGHWEPSHFERSWRHGAEMLLRSGTTTVADIEAVPSFIPRLWQKTPLRVISYRELISLKDQPPPAEKVAAAIRLWTGLAGAEPRVGLSPHAPYSTTPELLRQAARQAKQARWRLTIHVAESEDEFLMFCYRHGPLHDWLKTQRDMSDCGLGSPVQQLERCGCLARNLVAVHANYLGRDDAHRLAKKRVSVAHCPRSHAYFQHQRFPLEELRAAGVIVCLGTDSLASTLRTGRQPLQLSMFDEMRAAAAAMPDLSPAAVVRMATVSGARALGLAGHLGELKPGAKADLIAIPYSGSPAAAYDAVVHHPGPVAASMIGGCWAIPPAA